MDEFIKTLDQNPAQRRLQRRVRPRSGPLVMRPSVPSMDAVEVVSAVTATSGMTSGLGRADTMRCFRLRFGISRDVLLNYATREHVEGLVIDSLVSGRSTAPTRPGGTRSRTSPVRCSASVDAWHAGGPQALRHEEI
jgi:hypothetical protein